MNKEEIFNYCLENLKSSEIKKDEPMKKHTSFKIGGNADIFIKISDLDDLKNILKFINENKINFTIFLLKTMEFVVLSLNWILKKLI